MPRVLLTKIPFIFSILFFQIQATAFEDYPPTETGSSMVVGDPSKAFSDAASFLSCGASKEALSDEDKRNRYETAVKNYTSYTCKHRNFHTRFHKAYFTYTENFQKCAERALSASTHCLEACSPAIKTAVAGANTILAGIRQTGLVDACGKMDKAMKVVQTGFTAFGANCGARKLACDSACSAAKVALEDMRSALNEPFAMTEECINLNLETQGAVYQEALAVFQSFKGSIEKEIAFELDASNKTTVAGRVKTCGGYEASLMAAGLNLLSAIAASKQANNCEQETTAQEIPECEKEGADKNPKCICEKNPRNPGCPLYSGGGGGFGSDSSNFTSTSTNSPESHRPTDPNMGPTGGGDDSDSNSGIAANSSGGAGAPMGGGASLEGGGMGGNGADGARDVIRKINTNVHSGEGGGGGGGWSSGRGGSRSTAGQYGGAGSYGSLSPEQRELELLRAQVSSPGGKSNWEKVKSRYADQKATLLNH